MLECCWLVVDVVLLLPGALPGVIALCVDYFTGAWRKLDDPLVIKGEGVVAGQEPAGS